VTADETVSVEVTLFLAYTPETAGAEVQRAIASCHRAGKALGDLCSKQTWCCDQHCSLHHLLLPTTNGRSARQFTNDVKEKFSTFGSAPV